MVTHAPQRHVQQKLCIRDYPKSKRIASSHDKHTAPFSSLFPVRVFAFSPSWVDTKQVDIPWAKLGSRPVKVLLQGVSVLAGPVDRDSWGDDEVRERRLGVKRAALDKAEAAAKKAKEGKGSADDDTVRFSVLFLRAVGLEHLHDRRRQLHHGRCWDGECCSCCFEDYMQIRCVAAFSTRLHASLPASCVCRVCVGCVFRFSPVVAFCAGLGDHGLKV